MTNPKIGLFGRTIDPTDSPRKQEHPPFLTDDPYEYQIHEPLITVEDLRLNFGEKVVLDGISFEVRNTIRNPTSGVAQGQIVALLGPSGIGKSTITQAMAAMRTFDPVRWNLSGNVLIGSDRKPVEPGQVGVVTQKYPLFEEMSVLDNLVVAGTNAGLSRNDAAVKANSLLERFGLAEEAHSWPAELSGGQRQRAAILQQIMCSEDIMIMDEPFTGLDPVAKDRACRLIEEVSMLNERNSFFVITHDVYTAVELADQIVILGRDRNPAGKIISGAKVQRIIDLKEMGIAWRPNRKKLPAYYTLVDEIIELFKVL